MADSKPQIGLLGIMQELYDAMLPGITERQAAYAQDVAQQLSDVATVHFPRPARNRADIEAIVDEFERGGMDGIMIVMLTYGPSMNATRALTQTRLPVMLANIQPERTITPEWDMGDMTYNQGIHGAQDQANLFARAGISLPVITGDWHAEPFKRDFEDWARAAAAVSMWSRLKVAIFGYHMNGMGDTRVDAADMLRELGPQIDYLSPGDLYRAMQAVSDGDLRALIDSENTQFDVDPRLSPAQREESARFQLGIKRVLDEGGYKAYSTHFGSIAEDGRFGFLPLAAASSLMAEGYGFGAEGDPCSAALVAAGHVLAGTANFTEMYAMDFYRDSILMSHMGEGNWKIARTDRKVRLIDRPLGIGALDNPPTFLFQMRPGAATIASLAPMGGADFRLIVSEGEILDTEEMPKLEMPYGHFRPDSGVRECMNGWLRAGGTHHQVMNMGRYTDRWGLFCELLDIEMFEV